VSDETEKQRERPPDIPDYEELSKLIEPHRSKGISRVNGVIALCVGIGALYFAIVYGNYNIGGLLFGVFFVGIGIAFWNRV
jgi:hypothetical protein